MGLKVLWAGDTPSVPTGFGVVSKNILTRLVDRGYEIQVLGVNHYGDPYDFKQFPFPIYPCDKGGNFESIFGVHKLWAIAENFKPDIIFILNDPWVLKAYMKNKPKNLKAKIVGYYPVDAGPLKPDWLEVVNELDAQVVYSHYAEATVTSSNKGRPKNMHQIYHGVNTKIFRPVPQAIARTTLGIPPDLFIVGMVARNQYRKRFDILMDGFAKFAEDKDDVKLYMHTAVKDIGFDILDLIAQNGIEGKTILTENMNPNSGVSEQRLNLIYNTFDVNVLLTLGEGFGLPIAESMSTGCPQLVSGHSTAKELVENHGGLTVKTAAYLANISGINTWGSIPDVDDFVEKLQLLYENKPLRMSLAEDGYAYIHQPQFTWEYAVDQFEGIFRELFHLLPRRRDENV